MKIATTTTRPPTGAGTSSAAADPWLAAYLQRNPSVCPTCRRPLAGLSANRCPACHTGLALGLAPTEAYLAAWGVLVAATLGAAGFGLFFDAIIFLRGMRLPGSGSGHLRYVISMTTAISGPVMLGISLVILRTRRRFCALGRGVQWALAALGTLLLLLVFFAFALFAI